MVPVVSCRILAIHEDDAFHRDLRRVATDAGHVVTALSSLGRAVDVAQRLRPDIITLSLGLRDGSGRDGRDLLNALRKEPNTAQIPVLALSAEPALHARLALELGAEAVLTTPVDATQVVSKIERIVLRTSSGKFEAGDDVGEE